VTRHIHGDPFGTRETKNASAAVRVHPAGWLVFDTLTEYNQYLDRQKGRR